MHVADGFRRRLVLLVLADLHEVVRHNPEVTPELGHGLGLQPGYLEDVHLVVADIRLELRRDLQALQQAPVLVPPLLPEVQHQRHDRVAGLPPFLPVRFLVRQYLRPVAGPVIPYHPEGDVHVDVGLVLKAVQADADAAVPPELGDIPFLTVNLAIGILVFRQRCGIAQLVLFYQLPAAEQQDVDYVGEHVVIGFERLLRYILIPHDLILSHSRRFGKTPSRPLLQAVRPCGGIGAVRPQARAEPSVNRLGGPSAIHAAASVRNPGVLSRRAAVAAGRKGFYFCLFLCLGQFF